MLRETAEESSKLIEVIWTGKVNIVSDAYFRTGINVFNTEDHNCHFFSQVRPRPNPTCCCDGLKG